MTACACAHRVKVVKERIFSMSFHPRAPLVVAGDKWGQVPRSANAALSLLCGGECVGRAEWHAIRPCLEATRRRLCQLSSCAPCLPCCSLLAKACLVWGMLSGLLSRLSALLSWLTLRPCCAGRIPRSRGGARGGASVLVCSPRPASICSGALGSLRRCLPSTHSLPCSTPCSFLCATTYHVCMRPCMHTHT